MADCIGFFFFFVWVPKTEIRNRNTGKLNPCFELGYRGLIEGFIGQGPTSEQESIM